MAQEQVAEILKTEFSEAFVQGMRDRMVVSFYKYGPVAQGYGPEGKVDAIASLTDRLRKYAATGNTEFLMDAGNFAMIEFMHPRHPQAHFKGTDSDESPGRRAATTGVVDHRSNASIGERRMNPNSKVAAFR